MGVPDDVLQAAGKHADKFLTEDISVDEVIEEAIIAERKRCSAIARRKEEHAYDDCECLGFTDPETGLRECSLEARGHDCLCAAAAEIAAAIASEIDKGE